VAKIGIINSLRIVEPSEHGLYLDGGPLGNILLPNQYVQADMELGNTIDVFIYNDSEDRLVATTETPFAQVGEFAYLEVVSINPKAGAFLDWGLQKDLLLPYREQGDLHLEAGDGVIVALYLDTYTNRIAASTRLHKYIPEDVPDYQPNDPVHVLIYGDSPLGYKAIIDKHYRGLLYHEETSDILEPGDQFTGYIKKVHNSGKIDLRRDPSGYDRVETIAEQVLRLLKAEGGKLPYNDKSTPEVIREKFNTSKKAFKQATGALYKQRLIEFTKFGIKLTDTPSEAED
jgi:hypothetical protein